MPPEWTVSLGESNEQLREKFNIARERQDAFAYRSHRLAHQAWQDGFYDDIVTRVPEVVLARDEGIRSDTTPDKLAALKPSFRPDDHHGRECLAAQRWGIGAPDGFRAGGNQDRR